MSHFSNLNNRYKGYLILAFVFVIAAVVISIFK